MTFSLTTSIAILGRTPLVLTPLLADLPEPLLNGREGPESWSPLEVLGHLVHGELTDWIPRARIIREQGEARPFPPFDRTAHLQQYRGRPVGQLLAEFRGLRTQGLSALKSWALTESDLDRRGWHPSFGPVTLRELLATWVVHDLGHIAQISRVLAKQHTADVGPWSAYLPVLRDRA